MLTHVIIRTTHGEVHVLPHQLGVQRYTSKRAGGAKVVHVSLTLVDPLYSYKGKFSSVLKHAHVKFRVMPDFACLATQEVMAPNKEPPHRYWYDLLPPETVRAVSDWVRDNWRQFGDTVYVDSSEYQDFDPVG